jgi:hypothetical protein
VLDHGKDLKRGLNGIAVEAIHESFTPRSVEMHYKKRAFDLMYVSILNSQ